MKNIFYFFILVSFNVEAASFFENKSLVCQGDSVLYKGITCCADELSETQCKTRIDAISPAVLKAIEDVQNSYYGDEYPYGAVPNCYWFASFYSNFLDISAPPRVTQSSELLSFMHEAEYDFYSEPIKGGVVIFHFQALERFYIETSNGSLRPVWDSVEFLGHAALYLGEGLVLQKENIGTSVFSLSTLEQTKEIYRKSFNEASNYRNVEIRLEHRMF